MVISCVKVKSLVFLFKGVIVLSEKSGSTPNSGFDLNVVPSVSVPNLLPKIVENKVFNINCTPSKSIPELTVVKLLNLALTCV